MGLADSTAAMKLLFQGEDQTASTVAAVEANTSRVSKAAMGVKAAWAVAGAATSVAVGFLGDAARASVEDAADVESLKQAVENSGESWDAVSGKINDRIKAGQQLAFTDDQVRDSLSLLTAQTGDMGEAMQRQSLAFDLARGAHIDLQTASKLLGKVTDENSNALARYGIHVKAQVQNAKVLEGLQKNVATAEDGVSTAMRAEQELRVSLSGKHQKSALDLLHLEDAHKRVTKAQGTLKDAQVALTKEQDKETGVTEVLAQVQQKFGGQADAYSKTNAAAAFRMKDAFDEWKESVGSALGGAQPFVAMLPGISSGLTIAGGAMGPVAKGLLDVAKSERVAAIGSTILNIAMGPIGLVILALAAAVGLLALAWANNWGDIRGKTAAAITFIGGVIKVVGPVIKQFLIDPIAAAVGFVRGHWDQIKAVVLGTIGVISAVLRGDWGGALGAVSGFFKKIAGAIVGIFTGIHIPLPHFTFKGNFNPADWAQGKGLPALNVNWYGRGGAGVALGPTLIGVGESGPEAFSVRPLGKGDPRDDTGSQAAIDKETKDLLRAQLRATQEQNFILRAILGSGGSVTPLAAARRLA